MFDDDFGFGGGCGSDYGGDYGGPPVALAAANGLACPPAAAFDPCDPRLQRMLARVADRDYKKNAMARRGIRARAASGNPVIPVGFGTIAGSTVVGPNGLIAPGASQTFTVTPPFGQYYCFTDWDISRRFSQLLRIMSLTFDRYTVIADPVGIPADTLDPDAIHPLLDLGSIYCNGTVTAVVFNEDTANRPFSSTLWAMNGGRDSGGPCLT